MKQEKQEFQFSVASSPQIRTPRSTARIMVYVILALLPAALWGVYQFGWYAAAVLAVSVAAAAAGEGAICLIRKKNTLSDGSAVLTGLLVGMNMPPSVPLYIPAVASLAAVIVFKGAFGGLGCNIINPALGGRLIAFFSWSSAMFTFQTPRTILKSGVTVAGATGDAMTSATPLTFLKSSVPEYAGSISNEMEVLSLKHYSLSKYDAAVTDKINSFFGENFCYGYFDAFFGIKGLRKKSFTGKFRLHLSVRLRRPFGFSGDCAREPVFFPEMWFIRFSAAVSSSALFSWRPIW